MWLIKLAMLNAYLYENIKKNIFFWAVQKNFMKSSQRKEVYQQREVKRTTVQMIHGYTKQSFKSFMKKDKIF